MSCKHEADAAKRDLAGNICVIRDESLNYWTVLICPGLTGERQLLGKFSTQGEAFAFAKLEVARINKAGGGKRVLHVDDCPCWQKQL